MQIHAIQHKNYIKGFLGFFVNIENTKIIQ